MARPIVPRQPFDVDVFLSLVDGLTEKLTG